MVFILCFQREKHSIARELAHMQKKEQKEENAKMGQLKRIEEKAVKLAAKVADMQKAERDREARKIARILECEKEARQVAAFLVDTYADDRKSMFASNSYLFKAFSKIKNARMEFRIF